VRYVLTSVSPERTRLRIDAIFVEKARRMAHASDGTVESSESRLFRSGCSNSVAEQEAEDALAIAKHCAGAAKSASQREDESTRLAAAQSSLQD